MKKTLYASDLDGTLLLPDRTIGPITRETLRRLRPEGLLFTAATARSIATVGPMLEGVDISAPLILLNGTVLYDRDKKEYLDVCYFKPEVADGLLNRLDELGLNAFIMELPELRRENGHGNQIVCDYRALETQSEREFYEERLPQTEYKRFNRVTSYNEVSREKVMYVSMTGPEREMASLRDEITSKFEVTALFYVDRYNEEIFFLEFAPPEASKKNAVLKVKEMVGAERLVCFGDNTNDLAMFSVADRCCAVANAIPQTIAAADEVIGSNVDEGVAKFVASDFRR